MSKKVLVISDYRPTSSVRPEAEIFIGLAKMGYSIDIMTYGEAEYCTRFREHGIRVIDFHPAKKFDRAEGAFIRKHLEEGKHDIIHLFNSKAIITGIRAAKNLPVKVVLYRGYTGNIHWYDPTAYLKFLHPRVDKIMCLAKSVEEWIARQMPASSRGKLITINKGHSLDWYDSIEPGNLQSAGVPAGVFTIACVANNRPMKGVKYLMQAICLLPPGLNIHFLLIGKGMDSPELKNIVKNSSYRSNIHYPGFRKDVLPLVKACDAFTLPSIKGEATTKAVIEAMALGIAPVISNVPGNRELVINEESGLVVPMKDAQALAKALERMHTQADLRSRLASGARRQIAENFNTERTVREVDAMYCSLFG
jgi:glycosyltransferase involved in cell wall biosynthesis